MFKIVLLQGALMLTASALGAWVWGGSGGVSALLGGLACCLPSAVFAWRLHAASQRSAPEQVFSFFLGEGAKVASTVGILVVVRLLYAEAHWGAVVLGIVLTLQGNFLALLVKS